MEILGRVRPSPFYSFAAALSWPVLKGLYRLRAEGKENLPAEGGYVLAANHTSNFDPWPLGMPLWPEAVSPVHGEIGAVLVAAG